MIIALSGADLAQHVEGELPINASASRPWRGAALVLAMVAASAVHAQTVYRCPGQGGVTSFQQAPCQAGVPMLIRTLNIVDAWRAPARVSSGRDAPVLALDLTPSAQRATLTRQALQRLPGAGEDAVSPWRW